MKVVFAVLLLVGLTSCSRRVDLLLDPPEWNFGSIPSNYTAQREISIHNRGVRAVKLRFISTCDCLYVQEAAAQGVAVCRWRVRQGTALRRRLRAVAS